MYDYLGVSREPDDGGGIIACELRHTLPDLTLTLGGQNVVLTWRDYTVEKFGQPPLCVVDIVGQPHDIAGIGMALMQKFDVLFDMDHNELGCKLCVALVVVIFADHLPVIEVDAEQAAIW